MNPNPRGSMARIANSPSIISPKARFKIQLPQLQPPPSFEKRKNNWQDTLARIIFLFFITGALAMGFAHPRYSHDVLLYTGAALSLEESNGHAIHDQTFDMAAKNLPPEEFNKMTTNASDVINREFYSDIFKNSQQFIEQLPTVKFKPLYIVLLFALMKVGIDAIHGSVLISCISWGLLALLVQKWLRVYLKPGIAEAAAAGLLLLAGILDYGGNMGPDILSALIVVAVFWSIFIKKEAWITLGFIFVAMLIRLDLVLLIILYLPYAKFVGEKKISWEGAFAAGSIALAMLVGIEKWAGLHSWHVHFYHSFIQRLSDPASFTGSVNLGQYLSTILLALRMKPPCNLNWFFIAMAVAGILIARPGSLRKNVLFHLTCIAGLASTFHFFIFPEPVPRFFIGYYVIVGVFLIAQVRRVKQAAWRPNRLRLQRSVPAFQKF
jgi:hypothetical protein